MKTSRITFALAAFATAAFAHAAAPVDSTTGNQDAVATTQWAPAIAMPMGKTRAEVRQELARARQSGELDALRKRYSGH
ncbi:hypothetical protein BLA50215_01968 [Burkholderia lata]|uniref:DUF4148 domain-containing protein n=1 Tax=Burkholderia lata (strain ATCC 17760 / DSM 23089 / LMG 22485 / NCIMB 9086 / R18194 / 383) TaxID=482957 RepID=UPI00145408DC|nr:DUF4148 domain-containing protein [Burkholderia lata]VWC91954.1 hypothetical protein BLA50215_01968 [Burkholderia lata]